MQVEPFELKGKTIADAHFLAIDETDDVLVIEFTDGTKVQVEQIFTEDDVSGNVFPAGGILITKQ